MKRTALLLVTGLVAALWVLHGFVRAPAADGGLPSPAVSPAILSPADESPPSAATTVAPAPRAEAAAGDRQAAASADAPRPIAWQMAVSLVDALEPMVLPVLAPHAPAPDVAGSPGGRATEVVASEGAAAPATAIGPEVAPMPRAPLAAPVTAAAAGQHVSPCTLNATGRQGAGRWCRAAVDAARQSLDWLPQAAAAAVKGGTISARQALSAAADPLAQQLEAWRKAVVEDKPVVAVVPGNSATPRPTAVASDSPKASESSRSATLSPEMQELADKVHQALDNYRHERLLNTGSQSPWEIMHRIVAFGIPTEIRRDGPSGERLNAIGWLLYGGRCSNQPLVVLNNARRPTVMVGPGVQGHPGQFLAMLAQSHVSSDSPFEIGGRKFAVRDLIDEEEATCDPQIELTFKLIALSYYLKSDAEWTSRDGQPWSISRLVQEEIRQPIRGAACGGTHRLFGLASSYKMRIRDGLPIDGQFRRAQTYIRDYQRYTLGTLRNADGSFSTDWFARPADSGDMARKIQTTGHILEWLVFSLDDEQLQDPRIVHSVDFIASSLVNSPDRDWSVGPLGHALHALALYDQRVFHAATPPESAPQVAARGDLNHAERWAPTAPGAAKSPVASPVRSPPWNFPLGPKFGRPPLGPAGGRASPTE